MPVDTDAAERYAGMSARQIMGVSAPCLMPYRFRLAQNGVGSTYAAPPRSDGICLYITPNLFPNHFPTRPVRHKGASRRRAACSGQPRPYSARPSEQTEKPRPAAFRRPERPQAQPVPQICRKRVRRLPHPPFWIKKAVRIPVSKDSDGFCPSAVYRLIRL